VLKKIMLIVLTWVVCLIPVWIYLIGRGALHPQGFWQELAAAGLGLIVLGSVQVFLFVIGIAITVIVLNE
jgi:hypothetical protein